MGSTTSCLNNTGDDVYIKFTPFDFLLKLSTSIVSAIGVVGGEVASALGVILLIVNFPIGVIAIISGQVVVFLSGVGFASLSIDVVEIGSELEKKGWIKLKPNERHTTGKLSLSLIHQLNVIKNLKAREVKDGNGEVIEKIIEYDFSDMPVWTGATDNSNIEYDVSDLEFRKRTNTFKVNDGKIKPANVSSFSSLSIDNNVDMEEEEKIFIVQPYNPIY
eukprot:TRINITY_DN35_c0_g1_i1.p1 TRINITY_DN35_c0_g1~~TRINITY_DN35_c0_g1_i1.p1  ORF type:complete len:219 (-),score=19.15 TRINITY_DN35_c0_g1_i1:205-861(-)